MLKADGKLYAFLTGMFLAFDFTGMFAGMHLAKTESVQCPSDLENLLSDMEKIGGDFQKALVNCHE